MLRVQMLRELHALWESSVGLKTMPTLTNLIQTALWTEDRDVPVIAAATAS